jgi:hypothetical protein
MSLADVTSFIDKSHLSIQHQDFAHFKYVFTFKSTFDNALRAFEGKGEQQRAVAARFNEYIATKLEPEIAKVRYFQNQTTYDLIESDLYNAIVTGDVSKVREIVQVCDIRRLPCIEGKNSYSQCNLLRNNDIYKTVSYWPLTHHMVFEGPASEEKCIDMYKYLFTNGFHPRQVLKMIKRKEQIQGAPNKPLSLAAVLLLAIEKKRFKLVNYLLGDDLLNLWGYPRFELVLETIKQFQAHDTLVNVFGTNSLKNVFASLDSYDQTRFIKDSLH